MKCYACGEERCDHTMEEQMRAIRAREKSRTAVGDDKLPAETASCCDDDVAT